MRKILIGAGCVVLVILVFAGCACSTCAYSAFFAAMFKHHTPTHLIGLLLVFLGVGGFGAMLWHQQLGSYGAALIFTAAFLPAAATLSTVFIFLPPWAATGEGVYAPLWGSGLALLAWVVAALFCRRFTDAEHAIPSSYAELRQRLDQLNSQIEVVCSDKGFSSDPRKNIACNQAKTQVEMMEEEFKQQGISWALAKGYINAWNRLHRAEEAMIEVAPQETVIAGALNDVMRLQGSQIDHDEDLIARIRQAIDVIDPYAKKYLQGAAATALPLVITTPSPLEGGYDTEPYSQKLVASGGTPPIQWSLSQGSTLPDNELKLCADGVITGTPKTQTSGAASFSVRATDSANVTATKAFTLTINKGPSPAPSPAVAVAVASGGNSDQQAQAQVVLRDVRCAINEFRDGRWNGLIVARNRLIATMMFTGMTAYTLLAIAIIMGAQPRAIAAAAAFYLVGATIGLLNQLRSASQNDSAVEDYGLSTARLITMPLFCGLAAIGGVVLMVMPQMANPYSSNTTPLAISTPSKLNTGVFDKVYSQRIDATGGIPPYNWSASNVNPPKEIEPKEIELKATGDLIAMLPKSPKSEKIIVTAEVKDSTGSSVEKSFFLKFTSAAKTSAGNQTPRKNVTTPSPTFVRPLEDIFDLHKNIIGLLLAAVFGLTPGLLFDRLQQQSEKYKSDLKGSESTQTKPQTPK